MNCPLCNRKANFYAETKPNGKIGIFCRYCQKGYYTTNPEDGWEVMEYNLKPPKDLAKREERLARYHNIDLTHVEREFKMFIAGGKL